MKKGALKEGKKSGRYSLFFNVYLCNKVGRTLGYYTRGRQ